MDVLVNQGKTMGMIDMVELLMVVDVVIELNSYFYFIMKFIFAQFLSEVVDLISEVNLNFLSNWWVFEDFLCEIK